MLFGSGPASAAMYAVHDCHARRAAVAMERLQWLPDQKYEAGVHSCRHKPCVLLPALDRLSGLRTYQSVYRPAHRADGDTRSLRHGSYVHISDDGKIRPQYRPLYKNAFIIAVCKLPQSALILLIWLFMAAFPVLAVYIVPGVAVFCIMIYLLLALIFTFSFMTLIAAVNARTQMNKVFK